MVNPEGFRHVDLAVLDERLPPSSVSPIPSFSQRPLAWIMTRPAG